jgi:hypothetical protein
VSEKREVRLSLGTEVVLFVFAIGFMLVFSGIRRNLDRIADALERAHPAPEAGK